MEKEIKWPNELNCAITVCDKEANILYMNEKSKATFKKHGNNIIGRNLKEFHGEKAWKMICEMIKENKSNHYTITIGEIKKIIHQEPWYVNGVIMGLVEYSFVIPMEMPHFDR